MTNFAVILTNAIYFTTHNAEEAARSLSCAASHYLCAMLCAIKL